MEILFLSHWLPFPPNRGDKIRSHAWFTELARKHRIHLGAFYDDENDRAHLETVRSLAGGQCFFQPISQFGKLRGGISALLRGKPISVGYFGSDAFARWVATMLRTKPIDAVLLFSSSMAPYLLGSDSFPRSRVVLDMVDVDSDKWRQYADRETALKSWIYRREARTLSRLEREAASSFGATILVSGNEMSHLLDAGEIPPDRIHVVGNGVDLKKFASGPFASPFATGEIPIVMTGRMDYRANVDGARWFIENVLPRVRDRIHRAKFYVVGADPSGPLARLHDSGVVVTGSVDDVRPYIQHASVIVAPLRIARGLQNKVLEAFAMEKPVVATSHAARALAVERGRELWIEDEPWGLRVPSARRSRDASVTGSHGTRASMWKESTNGVTSAIWSRQFSGARDLIAHLVKPVLWRTFRQCRRLPQERRNDRRGRAYRGSRYGLCAAVGCEPLGIIRSPCRHWLSVSGPDPGCGERLVDLSRLFPLLPDPADRRLAYLGAATGNWG